MVDIPTLELHKNHKMPMMGLAYFLLDTGIHRA